MAALEALSFDILEDSFISIFKPVIYGLTALGAVRVNISYKFVTPPLWYQKMCCVSFVALSTCVHSYLIIKAMDYFVDGSLLQAFLFCCQVHSELVLNSCVMILNNFFYKLENPKLLVTMQCINRCLKITEKDKKNIRLYKFNLYASIVLTVYHIILFIPICLGLSPLDWFLCIPATILFLPEQFETVLYFSVMFFLCARMRHINGVIETFEDSEPEDAADDDAFLRVWLAYKNIATVLRIVDKTFSPFLLFTVINTFFFHILTLQQLLTIVENQATWVLFFKAYWNGGRLWWRLLLVGVAAHYMDAQRERTQQACLRVIESPHTERVRRHAKNTLRVARQLAPASVFHMLPLRDLPLRFTFTTTTYVFMLLQFAFL